MVAIALEPAEKVNGVSLMGAPRRSRDPRRGARKAVALKAWCVLPERSARGFVVDLSETGARIGGVAGGFAEGQRMLFKVQLEPTEPPVICRAVVVRWHQPAGRSPELAVRFEDLAFDDWFRLARRLDRI